MRLIVSAMLIVGCAEADTYCPTARKHVGRFRYSPNFSCLGGRYLATQHETSRDQCSNCMGRCVRTGPSYYPILATNGLVFLLAVFIVALLLVAILIFFLVILLFRARLGFAISRCRLWHRLRRCRHHDWRTGHYLIYSRYGIRSCALTLLISVALFSRCGLFRRPCYWRERCDLPRNWRRCALRWGRWRRSGLPALFVVTSTLLGSFTLLRRLCSRWRNEWWLGDWRGYCALRRCRR